MATIRNRQGIKDENKKLLTTENRDSEKDSLDPIYLQEFSKITRQEIMRGIDDIVNRELTRFSSRAIDYQRVCKSTNDSKNSLDDKNKRIKKDLPEKEFFHRNSVLTELLKISHFKSLYNFFLAVLIVIPITSVLKDYIKHGTIFNWSHIDFVRWSFSRLDLVVLTWLGEFLVAMVVLVSFQLWAKFRPKSKSIVPFDILTLVLYISLQLGTLILVTKTVFHFELPPGSSFILTIEKVRFMMKTHAFVSSNTKKAYVYKASGDQTLGSRKNSRFEINQDDKNHELKEHLQKIDSLKRMSSGSVQPSLSSYLYFLFAPTLVYRDSYPRTDGINWGRVLANLLEVIFCIFYTQFIFERFLATNVVRPAVGDYFSIANACYLISATSFSAGLLMLLAFFSLLHSWMNLFGEILCFGDRLFYEDWWNSTNYAQYYRKWNVVVHDWLYSYIYIDVSRATGSRTLASLLVFFVSALFHEYILCVSFKFFYPVLLTLFGVFGVILYFLKSRLRFGNLSIWLSLMVGNAIHMVLYTMEWYARIHCESRYEKDSLYDFFIPRSWSCVMKKL